MKAIDFTLNEIDTAIRGYRQLPRDMQDVAKELRDIFDYLYDKMMKAVERTTEDIARAQKDRSVVKSAIATTEDAIKKLQAVADAPAPEGQQKPPPPKDLDRAKKNLVRLKAIAKEIESTIKQLDTQLYYQKLHRDYLRNALGAFNNSYNTQSSIVQGVVHSANSAASYARGALHALGASSSARMECDNPSYLRSAAESVEKYGYAMEEKTRSLIRSTSTFSSDIQDNVSRIASQEVHYIRSDIAREVDKTRSHAGRLRQAASYLDMYKNQAR